MGIRDKPAVTLTDHFAAALAVTGDIARAAARVNRSPAWGRQQFRLICNSLGVPVSASGDL